MGEGSQVDVSDMGSDEGRMKDELQGAQSIEVRYEESLQDGKGEAKAEERLTSPFMPAASKPVKESRRLMQSNTVPRYICTADVVSPSLCIASTFIKTCKSSLMMHLRLQRIWSQGLGE